jgi:MFS family permease
MIGAVYGMGAHKGALTPNQDLGLKIATPVGTLVGQLLFGYLADVVGRKKMYGLELMISTYSSMLYSERGLISEASSLQKSSSPPSVKLSPVTALPSQLSVSSLCGDSSWVSALAVVSYSSRRCEGTGIEDNR